MSKKRIDKMGILKSLIIAFGSCISLDIIGYIINREYGLFSYILLTIVLIIAENIRLKIKYKEQPNVKQEK